MLYLIVIIAAVIGLMIMNRYLMFRRSRYGEVSGINFWQIVFNIGNYGEFLTFNKLEKLPGESKLLTNIYIPKSDGTTTEIDLLLINSKGIYVFESKNYSGWIFGDEKNKNWTQSLKGGKKIKFLNPIWQNKGHINALRDYLKEANGQNLYSYIVFSERCELKKVTVTSADIKVLKRENLQSELKKDFQARPDIFDEASIQILFERLEKLTKADEAIKAKHIANIKAKFEKVSTPEDT
jgi:hypothetical protein